jgi:CHAD domain-containing protein
VTAAGGKLARKLRKKRKRLLSAYDVEDLHALRVALRRIRSLLQQQPGHKARRLRRELEQLAAATNGARDWDTLYCYALNTLTAAQFKLLRPWLAQHRKTAHRQVKTMLKSRQWRDAYRRWCEIEHVVIVHDSASLVSAEEFARVAQRVNTASRKALAVGDDRSWHKLRIRIKELRYTLDSMGKPLSGLEQQVTLERCKRLQQSLGDWHDTVVHRQLLAAFLDADGDGAGERTTIVRALQDALRQRGRQCLQVSRETVTGPFLPGDW